MSIFKYLTLSHLQKVLAALEVRFTGVENEIEEINEININTSSRLNDIENNIPLPYDNLPNADFNNGARGSSDLYARGDHRHPSDPSKANVSDVLIKTNTTQYLPTNDYNPATKLYVDTKCSEPVVGTGTITISGTTASFASLSPIQVTTYWGRKNPVYYYESLGQGTYNKRRYELISVVNDGAFYDFVFYGTDGSSDIYITTHIYSSNSEATGFNGTVHSYPAGGTQSDWDENDSTDGSYILNKPAIKAGTSNASIMVGQIEQDPNYRTFTIYVSGDANVTTYTYTTSDTIDSISAPDYVASYTGSVREIYYGVRNIDTTNRTITFSKTLSYSSSVSSKEITLHYYYKTTDSYSYTYAEGAHTISTGYSSHAEGINSKAMGGPSHAEGSGSIAHGTASHAEGQQTCALELGAHSEGGGSIADGTYSHSEGSNTVSHGDYSHSEGNGTIASGISQHVQGKYNIEDTNETYADIVGNGANDSSRSNAYTLDWSGNGWFAGKLTVGASPIANMDVATKKYVDDATSGITTNLSGLTDTTISSPTDGQLLKYNATTSKWENVTLSLAINNGVIQLKEGNTVISSASLPIYGGEVTEIWNGGNY